LHIKKWIDPILEENGKKEVTVRCAQLQGLQQKIKSKYQKHVSDIRFLCYIMLLIRGLIVVWNPHRSVVRRTRGMEIQNWPLLATTQWKHPFPRQQTTIATSNQNLRAAQHTSIWELQSQSDSSRLLVRGRNISLFIVHLIHPILISFTTPIPSSAISIVSVQPMLPVPADHDHEQANGLLSPVLYMNYVRECVTIEVFTEKMSSFVSFPVIT
jgi:hypothetical protein